MENGEPPCSVWSAPTFSLVDEGHSVCEIKRDAWPVERERVWDCVCRSVTMNFKNEAIRQTLCADHVQRAERKLEGGSTAALRVDDNVAYVLFLEQTNATERAHMESWVDRVADWVIRVFSPAPVMMHCELFLPPSRLAGGQTDERVHFATYLGGGGAHWQNVHSKLEGVPFYLVENGARWRAVPVVGPSANVHMRAAAERCATAPYSIGMYLTSARYTRNLANFYSDTPQHGGHCATIQVQFRIFIRA